MYCLIIDQINEQPENGLKSSPETSRFIENKWISPKKKIKKKKKKKLHCPTNDSYNICIQSCCLPCKYVTKPSGILQSVIKSQRVYIYHLDSGKVGTFSLRKVIASKLSGIFKFFERYKKF